MKRNRTVSLAAVGATAIHVAGIVVGTAGLMPVPLVAESSVPAAAPERLRPLHPRVKRLLVEGQKRSRTFARLLWDLGQSNVIVYIDLQPDSERPDHQRAGSLQFMASVAGQRLLRVCVYVSRLTHDLTLIAILAYELQHALEVANANSVHTVESFAALYREIGTEKRRRVFETKAAQELEQQVVSELRSRGVRTTRTAWEWIETATQ